MVGSRRRAILLSLTALGIIVVALAVFSVRGFAISYVEEQEREFSLQPGEALVVRGFNGAVTYEHWAGDTVVIKATTEVRAATRGLAEQYARRIRVEMTRESDGVHAVASGPLGSIGWNAGVAFRIRVPEGWAGQIRLETSNGSVTAENLNGEASLRTSNGSISVQNHKGALNASTSNGRIELAGVDTVLRAETTNGSVRIEEGLLRGSGRIHTTNGSIDLHTELIPEAVYDAHTSNGSITLTLVDPDVALDLRTTNSSIRLNTEVVASVAGGQHLVGRIGSGAARLTATTSNGRIVLSAAR